MAKPEEEVQVYGSEFDFDYSEEAASKADSAADRLTESGLYLATFKCVNPFKSEKGSIGVQFDVELADGGNTNFALYVRGRDGKEIHGMQNYQGIRTIFGLKSRASPIKGMIRSYDSEEKKFVEKEGPVYADMIGKPIYLVLQKELYTRDGGKESFRFGLVTAASAESKKTAKEIIAGAKDAKRLAKIMATLTDKDSRKAKAKSADADLGLDDPDTEGI